MPECPICNRTFPATQIERHANSCLDNSIREHGGDPEEGRRPAATSPPARPTSATTPRSPPPAPRVTPTPARTTAATTTTTTTPARSASANGRGSTLGRTGTTTGTAGAGTGAAAAAAPPEPEAAAPEVTRNDIEALIDAIHVRRFDRDELAQPPAGALAGLAGSAAAAASSFTSRRGDAASGTWTPDFKPIKGLLYVRVAEVHLPPSKDFLSSLASRAPIV
jgi:hypothetical protein